MESFFQVRQARNHVTSLEDRTRDIESQIGNIRSTISEIRQNIRHREIQIEENESNLVQTGNERFIKMIEKENYLLDQARIKARPVALLGGHCLRQLVSSTAPCGIRTKWPSERRTPFYLATFYRIYYVHFEENVETGQIFCQILPLLVILTVKGKCKTRTIPNQIERSRIKLGTKKN